MCYSTRIQRIGIQRYANVRTTEPPYPFPIAHTTVFTSQNASAAAPDAPPTATRTIEGILFKALVEVGAVAAINADDPKKVDLSRAARTDAGVSAAGNVWVFFMGAGSFTKRLTTHVVKGVTKDDYQASRDRDRGRPHSSDQCTIARGYQSLELDPNASRV